MRSSTVNIHSHLTFNLLTTISLWTSVTVLLFSVVLLQAPTPDERRLYSDIATHVMIASSIWHDRDLRYTLTDLDRFRTDYPSETGPRGLFLKVNQLGELSYAKPHLYGFTAAWFYGLLGIPGFLLLNSICASLVGAVAAASLKGTFGAKWANVAALGFILPSAFIPWIYVPHPDIFIAALLSGAGYLLLSRGNLWSKVLGSILLGCVLHEKITFLFVVPFLLFAVDTSSWFRRVVLILTVLSSWLVVSLPNLIFDGSFLAYQGLRFYIGGAPFPLEDGWQMPVRGMFKGDMFNPVAMLSTLSGNIALLPMKLHDFFIGRQTGIIPYFTVAFGLLLVRILATLSRSCIILIGLFAYLSVNWLVFPSNGYGGTGSYGSRYLLQIVGLIPLSYLGCKIIRSEWIWMITRSCLIISLMTAVCFQFRVFFDGHNLVQHYYRAIQERPYIYFPLEASLLPTIFAGELNTYVESSKSGNEKIFILQNITRRRLFTFDNNYVSTYVLYQSGPTKPFRPLELFSPNGGKIKITNKNRILWENVVSAGEPKIIDLKNLSYDHSFFDFLDRREKRFVVINADFKGKGQIDVNPTLSFASEYQPFNNYDKLISAENFSSSNLYLQSGWSDIEPWGVWSDADYASILTRMESEQKRLELRFSVHGYTPLPHTEQIVTLSVNGEIVDRLELSSQRSRHSYFIHKPEGIEYLNIIFVIENAVSPLSLGRGNDPRRLGVGISELGIWRAYEQGDE